jgi:hypothetical protein
MEVLREEEQPEDKDLIPTQCLVIYPVYGDWKALDLARYGLAMFRAYEPEFKELIEEHLYNRLGVLKTINAYGFNELCYVVTNDSNKADNLWSFYSFLLLIKPSRLLNPIAQFQIDYHKVEGVKQKFSTAHWSIWDNINVGDGVENPFLISKREAEEFYFFYDSYLKKHKENDKEFRKLENIYRAAINNKDPFIKFIILMTVVECLIEGKDEVTYKIRRVTAILLGTYDKSSEIIFKNMGILYNDRSNFVHNGDVENLTIKKIEYHHNLVCAIFGTLLLGNISLTTLAEKTNKYGFGQRQQLLAEYGIKEDANFLGVIAGLLTELPRKPKKEQSKKEE